MPEHLIEDQDGAPFPEELQLTLGAMWNALRLLGFDTDGDSGPGAFIAGMGIKGFSEMFLDQVAQHVADEEPADYRFPQEMPDGRMVNFDVDYIEPRKDPTVIDLTLEQARVLAEELEDTTKAWELETVKQAILLMEGSGKSPWHVSDPRLISCIMFFRVTRAELR